MRKLIPALLLAAFASIASSALSAQGPVPSPAVALPAQGPAAPSPAVAKAQLSRQDEALFAEIFTSISSRSTPEPVQSVQALQWGSCSLDCTSCLLPPVPNNCPPGSGKCVPQCP